MLKNKYFRCFLFGITLVFLVPALRNDWTILSFCDGFSLAGILLLSYGLLRFLNTQSAFEGIFYIGRRIKSLLMPFLGVDRVGYSPYRQEKEIKTRTRDSSALIVGAGYLSFAIGLLFFV